MPSVHLRVATRLRLASAWLTPVRGAGAALFIAIGAWLSLLAVLFFFAIRQPIYSPIDEFNHFFYVQYLFYDHRPPAVGLVYEATKDPNAPPALSIPPSRGMGAPTGAKNPSTEGIQPPGYYALMAPIFALTRHGSYSQIIAIRLVTATLASLLVPLTFLLARVAVPGVPWVWGAASLVTVLSRGYAYNMSQITNDPLAIVVGTGAALAFLWLARARLDWRWGLIAGLISGVALVSKVTVYFVSLIFAATFLVRLVRQRFTGGWVPASIVGSLTAALLALPWLALSYHRYHGLAPKTDWAHQPAVLLQYHNLPLLRTFQLMLDLGAIKFWVGEGGRVFPAPWMFTLAELGCLLCAAGLLSPKLWRTRPLPSLALLFGWSAAGLGVLAAIILYTELAILVGRYIYPLFGALAVVVAGGANQWGAAGRWLLTATLLLLLAAMVVGVLDAVSFVSQDCRC